MSKIQKCAECDWFRDYGQFGFCENVDAKGIYPHNKMTFEESMKNTDCEHFDDSLWFGG